VTAPLAVEACVPDNAAVSTTDPPAVIVGVSMIVERNVGVLVVAETAVRLRIPGRKIRVRIRRERSDTFISFTQVSGDNAKNEYKTSPTWIAFNLPKALSASEEHLVDSVHEREACRTQ
jgi:hypothetical protein